MFQMRNDYGEYLDAYPHNPNLDYQLFVTSNGGIKSIRCLCWLILGG
jgi:hypothetical protein